MEEDALRGKRFLQNWSAELCGADHELIVATLWVKFKSLCPSNNHPWVFHMNKQRKERARCIAMNISNGLVMGYD